MDIATLLESHRRHMLASAKEHVDPKEFERVSSAIEHDHDRATTRTLLDLYRSGQTGNGQQPVGQAALTTPPPTASRKVKAGSKAARARALKAGETRRKNLAAKAQQQGSNTPTNYKLAAVANEPAGQPFVQTGEGGGQ